MVLCFENGEHGAGLAPSLRSPSWLTWSCHVARRRFAEDRCDFIGA